MIPHDVVPATGDARGRTQHSRPCTHALRSPARARVVHDAWKDEHVKKALDLCLSCKACKSECPTNVDVATYKAEFWPPLYEGRRRPLHAYAFGMIDRWAQLGSIAALTANFFSQRRASATSFRARCIWPRSAAWPQFAPLHIPKLGQKNRVPGLGEKHRGCVRRSTA